MSGDVKPFWSDMSSHITIQRQQVHCHIGVTEEERAEPQMLEVSVTFPIPDCEKLAEADDIHKTVNYFDVSTLIRSVASERPRTLIETLASDIVNRLMREYSLEKVELEIRKFILPDTEAVVLNYLKTGRPDNIPYNGSN